jgi:hypothetical protein
LHTLDAMGALDHRTVIIHGAAPTPTTVKLMRRRRAA